MKLDSTNWQILELLQQEARMSYAEIGKEVGLTAPAVAERVRKLEEAGIITGYHAHVNLDALGLTLMGLVHVQNPKIYANRVTALAQSCPEVLTCDEVTGQNNYVLRVIAANRAHLRDVIQRFLEYGMTTSSVVLARHVVFKPITAAVWRFGEDGE